MSYTYTYTYTHERYIPLEARETRDAASCSHRALDLAPAQQPQSALEYQFAAILAFNIIFVIAHLDAYILSKRSWGFGHCLNLNLREFSESSKPWWMRARTSCVCTAPLCVVCVCFVKKKKSCPCLSAAPSRRTA